MRQWLRIAGDRLIVRRAAATSVIVGALLTAVNHGPRLLRGDVDPALAWQVALTFAVPFVVSTVASVAAIRSQRADRTAVLELLEGEIEAINKFPGQNPNPVMRMGRDGRLLYANDASEPISTALGLTVGELVPAGLRDDLWEAGQAQPARQLEVVSSWRTFSVLPVPVPELEVLNLYGTDVTAAKVVERFPDSNPNPVLRTAEDWRLIYANPASTALVEGLGLRIGDRLRAADLGPGRAPARHQLGARATALEPRRAGLERDTAIRDRRRNSVRHERRWLGGSRLQVRAR